MNNQLNKNKHDLSIANERLNESIESINNEVGIGLNLVSVIECDSTGVYVWYAHSGKDVREYIEVKPLENNQQPIKEEELIIIKEL